MPRLRLLMLFVILFVNSLLRDLTGHELITILTIPTNSNTEDSLAFRIVCHFSVIWNQFTEECGIIEFGIR